ncbi:translation elongation factor Ts [Candidatus Peregrinibacteria bacterium]|nr:translation elongation factor Ts [Candidatus Peregrinibacteria bacterium]
MSITASQVKALRDRTGVSMMGCKSALEESGGDEEKAIEILRKKGEAKAATKADRETKEGLIATKIEGNKAVIVTQYCETDFVAKNEEFVAIANKAAETAISSGIDTAKAEADTSLKELFTKLGENMSIEIDLVEGEGLADYVHTNGKVGTIVNLASPDADKARDVAMHITAMNPIVLKPEDLPEDVVIKEREIWKEQLLNEGKPAEMLDKIMIGKEKKFREESALIKQSFVKDSEKTIEEYLEGNSITTFVRKGI